MGKIPEVIDLDTQAMRLLSTFIGNMDFEAVRGKCGGGFLPATDALMRTEDGKPKAPSAGVRDLKTFLTSFANVRNKIAQLERDGFDLAVHEVREALECPDYRMLGEIHPFTETTPITLVMFNPDLTLSLLQRPLIGHYYTRKELETLNIPEDRLHLFKLSDQQKDDKVLASSIYEKLFWLNDLLLKKLGTLKSKKKCAERNQKALNKSVTLPVNRKEQYTKIAYGRFATVCYAKKDAVLRCFSKNEQEHIATWQFHLPKEYAGLQAHQIHFGLHLAAENNYWQNKRAPFCSINACHGYGAIAYPGEAYKCFDERSKKFRDTRILLY